MGQHPVIDVFARVYALPDVMAHIFLDGKSNVFMPKFLESVHAFIEVLDRLGPCRLQNTRQVPAVQQLMQPGQDAESQQ